MDGLEVRGQVVLIAATNLPDSLDPALRRPGASTGRSRSEFRTRRAAARRWKSTAAGCHWPGRRSRANRRHHARIRRCRLAALCREAAMSALRRLMPTSISRPPIFRTTSWAVLEVEWAEFPGALAEVEPSALREVATEISDMRWVNAGGLDEAKRLLTEVVLWAAALRPRSFNKAGVRAPLKEDLPAWRARHRQDATGQGARRRDRSQLRSRSRVRSC